MANLKKKKPVLGKKNSLSKKTKVDFDSMLDPGGLPGLPVITSGTPEEIALQETQDMMSMIRESRKGNAERFRDIESGEFWFCVCFQGRTQKEEFLEKLFSKFSPGESIENFGDKYISGLELAAVLGVEIEPITLEVKKNRLAPKSLRGMEVI